MSDEIDTTHNTYSSDAGYENVFESSDDVIIFTHEATASWFVPTPSHSSRLIVCGRVIRKWDKRLMRHVECTKTDHTGSPIPGQFNQDIDAWHTSSLTNTNKMLTDFLSLIRDIHLY